MANDGKAKGEISLEMLTLGKIVGKLREDQDITQKDMEAATGIAQPQLSGFENGKKGMSVESLAAIGRKLGTALRVPPELTNVVAPVRLGSGAEISGRADDEDQATDGTTGIPTALLNAMSVVRSNLSRVDADLESFLERHPRLRPDVRFCLSAMPQRTKHGVVKNDAYWDKLAKYIEHAIDGGAAKRGAKGRKASGAK